MFKKLLVVVISLSLIISAAEWQSLNGPATGLGEDISMGYDPNIPAWVIYSADAMYKLYKSVNEGEYWEPIQHQDINNPVCVITDPNNAQVVYIGKNADLPVWKSEDGGQTWEPKSYGITNTRPLCFAMDPTNSSIIYAGFDWDGGVHCLFKTTDAGVCWTDCNLAYSVRDIWIHPSNPEILYVATNSSVWKSTDGGCSWIELSTPSSSDVYCVAMVPEQNALFISIVEQNEPYNGSIYKTINDGAAWTRIFMSPEPPSYDLEILPTGLEIEKNTAGQIMYATYRPLGFYKSTDYGTSWVECNTGIGDKHLYSLMQHPNTPGCLFAGGCMAVYKSTDYGDSWIEITKGMRLAEVVKITEFDGTIWSGAYVPDYEYLYNDVPISGLVKSTNGGTYWKITHHANLHFIRDLEISASNPDIVFAVYQQEDRVGSYIFKTIDGGSNWVLKCYQGDYDIKDLTISNSTPDSVRACGHCFPPVWWYPKVWLTSDGGNNWQSFEFSSFLGRLYTIATDPMVSYTLYTSGRTEAGDISHGFEKSIDGGSDWGPVGSGCKKPIYKISIDPINTDIVYAAGDFGIFKSVNGANSFVGKSFGLSDSLTFDLTIDPEEPSIIYALVQEDTSSTTNSLYCTVDAAAKWFQFTLQPGNNPPEYIFDMCMDNVNFDKLYAGTERGAYAFYPQYINKHLVSSSYEATFANNG
ncbi:MAG: WD40/YVTN/BNR-like repeat-containing protein, partial [bacterium]